MPSERRRADVDETSSLVHRRDGGATSWVVDGPRRWVLALGVLGTLSVLGARAYATALGKHVNRRLVTFTVDAACPPDAFKARNAKFFEHSVVGASVYTKCPPQLGGRWTRTALTNIPTTKQYTGTAMVANDCEYGFILKNSKGKELYEIGGSNVDRPLRGAPCAGPTHAGGNKYWNRHMSRLPYNTTVTWAWGRCSVECPILCKILALSNEDEDNVYSVLERDKDEHWHRAEGHFATIHAGYTDVWASKSDKTMYRTQLGELNETNSHWVPQAGPSGSTLLALDIGLEEVWYLNTGNQVRTTKTDGSAGWTNVPGSLRGVALGKRWVWALTTSGGYVWASDLTDGGGGRSGIHHNFPENNGVKQCEVSLEYVFCVSNSNKVYRTGALLTWFKNGVDDSDGRWGWPNNIRPASVWELVPNVLASMVTVGDENVWVIEKNTGTIKFCPQPCATGAWVVPTGVPTGIVYIDASKYKDEQVA